MSCSGSPWFSIHKQHYLSPAVGLLPLLVFAVVCNFHDRHFIHRHLNLVSLRENLLISLNKIRSLWPAHEFCLIARTHDRYQSFDCNALCSCHGPCAVIPIWFSELNRRAAYLPPRHSFCNECDSTPSAAHYVACRPRATRGLSIEMLL